MTSDTAAGQGERKYALTKLAKGDYVCLSNDGKTWWRFHQHEDGPSYGLEDWPADKTFWRAVYCPREKLERLEPRYEGLPGPWDETVWTEAEWYLPTRRAAVQRMLGGS